MVEVYAYICAWCTRSFQRLSEFNDRAKLKKKIPEATLILIKLSLLTLSKTIIFNVFGTDVIDMKDLNRYL